MSILDTLGIMSFLLVVAFTWVAYNKETTGGQSPRSAITEAWINIGIGFSINYVANFMILPLVGAHFTGEQNFAMGWIYTMISLVRQYAIRRWFNARIHQAALILADTFEKKVS